MTDMAKRKLSKKERKDQKKQKQKKAQPGVTRSDPRQETVLAPDGSRPTVVIKVWSMRGLPHELQVAANHFLRDYEAQTAKLRSPGFEPAVDGGGSHGGHLRNIAAQQRVIRLREEIGADDFKVLMVMVISGRSAADIQAAGGPSADIVNNNLRRILRRVAGFYSGKPIGPDALMRAADKLMAAWDLDHIEKANALLGGLLARAG